MKKRLDCWFRLISSVAVAIAAHSAQCASEWRKGNLHTHSLWSDGDDYPESIAKWYKDRGYDFLMLSDHNTLQEGERWIDVEKNKGGKAAFDKYLKQFGKDWVATRTKDGRRQVKLRTLEEFRGKFEEPGKFLMIQGEEITAHYLPGPGKRSIPVHVNATNLRKKVVPQSGNDVEEVLRKNVEAVLEQRRITGQPMFPHLNHPNFHYAVTAEELMRVGGERFFEVYNGHPSVANEGDALHASTESIWDIVLTRRLAELGLPPLFGLATDDGHAYHSFNSRKSNPGRGWVMVRTRSLSPAAIVAAMEAGEFYASNGVTLDDVKRGPKSYEIQIRPEPGVEYTTQFIGTRKGYDSTHAPRRGAEGRIVRATHRYSEDLGVVLAEVKETSPRYRLKGDEIYVRAKILSTKPKANPYRKGEMEMAWTQPLIPAR